LDVNAYFLSLSGELNALKDRVRHLISGSHWQTDGEWKETVLRSVLRRHLPSSLEVGTGFIVAPNTASTQVDVLVYDSTKPVLFREGDLVFLAADSVKAVIEVKSKIHSQRHLEEVLDKLADKAEFVSQNRPHSEINTRGLYT